MKNYTSPGVHKTAAKFIQTGGKASHYEIRVIWNYVFIAMSIIVAQKIGVRTVETDWRNSAELNSSERISWTLFSYYRFDLQSCRSITIITVILCYICEEL
jgi:hypothetical protein